MRQRRDALIVGKSGEMGVDHSTRSIRKSRFRQCIAITVLTRSDCVLCERVSDMLARLQREFTLSVTTRELSDDMPGEVPIVWIDGTRSLSGVISERQLRRAIQRARWSRPISRILSWLRQG